MAVCVTTDIFCDWCEEWTHGAVSDEAAEDDARSRARKSGWICDIAGDFCSASCRSSFLAKHRREPKQ